MTTASAGTLHLLLAEDDKQLRTSIVRGLKEASYTVEQTGTGTQALSLAESETFDAIILDILLPGLSGLDVCRSIRERGDPIPILMLTALDSVEQRIAGLDAGADDYLIKPFDFGELLARLRALTRRHTDPTGGPIVVGDLVIDTKRHTVHRGEREIVLTAKEFAFLLYLAKNAGNAVSRNDLMTHVWDEHRQSYSNIIDVYASRLRRKLDDGESFAMFTTLRGTGFRLESPDGGKATAARTRSARRS